VEFLWPQPGGDELRTRYSADYYRAWGLEDIRRDDEALRRMKTATFALRLDTIARHRGPRRLLDVGCATGYLLELARRRGFEPYGIELSPVAAAVARERLPAERIHCGTLRDHPFPEAYFDAVAMCDVLEHEPDPGAALGAAYRLLQDGGVLALTTPDLDSVSRRLMGRRWTHYKREHLFYFRRRTVARLAAAGGFEVLEAGAAHKALTLSYVQSQLATYPHWLLSPVVASLHRIAFPSLRARVFHVTAGEMVALLRKRQLRPSPSLSASRPRDTVPAERSTMAPPRSVLGVVLLAAVLSPAFPVLAHGAVRLTCHDGDPNALVRRGANRTVLPFCNHDQAGDGVCTFAVCDECPFIRGCVGPSSGVCGDPPAPVGVRVDVPVGRKRVQRIGTSRVVFRCRAPRPTTTTTTLPGRACGPSPVDGACAGDCPPGLACLAPPPESGVPVACLCRAVSCQADADCEDGNPCSQDRCVRGACQHACLCVGPGGAATCCPGPVAECPTVWFPTCGDPVCGGHRPDPGVPACGPGEVAGAPCSPAGRLCDPGNFCNSRLLCASSDPTRGGLCPISRRADKEAIRYLDAEDVKRLHDEALRIRLATFRYRGSPASRTQLGFIIEDVAPSLSVDAGRDMVDLYGYTSMAVAALQAQAREIDDLRRALERLRAEVAGCARRAAR
jgi:2-polyprenyl-3-methyl-5-hydroxy-6-metoxy-1,4-benzoquinol methylase